VHPTLESIYDAHVLDPTQLQKLTQLSLEASFEARPFPEAQFGFPYRFEKGFSR
jgi:hypothetical protein